MKEDIIRMAREAGHAVRNIDGDDEVMDGDNYHIQTDLIERFAALVAAAEREAIMGEWWMCVQSDLENGVKSLNERAAEKWKKEYPAIAGFAATIEARGNT